MNTNQTLFKKKGGPYFKVFTFLSLLGLTMLSLSFGKAPLAIELYDGIVFEKVIGDIARLKPTDQVIRCEIKHDHPKIKENLRELADLIDKAAKETTVTSLHFMAQVPSIEIYATKVEFKDALSKKTSTTRIMLLKDHATLETRNGTAAEKLINLVNEICPGPAAPAPRSEEKKP
jgi:hypothetical protein